MNRVIARPIRIEAPQKSPIGIVAWNQNTKSVQWLRPDSRTVSNRLHQLSWPTPGSIKWVREGSGKKQKTGIKFRRLKVSELSYPCTKRSFRTAGIVLKGY